jgi:FkbM family methyltransferase
MHDPACEMPINGMRMQLPLSNILPLVLEQHKMFNSLLKRVSEHLHDKHGYLTCIDVGANIGDTISFALRDEKDLFLAIEPNPDAYQYLTRNWSGNGNVKALAVVCSSENTTGKVEIQKRYGTASVVDSESGIPMEKQTLDRIVDDYPAFLRTNLIKIDTDGHDFEVIDGARGLIAENRPVIFFECDIFSNPHYIEECRKVLAFFRRNGYRHFLLYDNFGNLMGKYSMTDLEPFENLLFYQLTSEFYYYDILVMKEEDMTPFYLEEIEHYIGLIPDTSMQRAAVTFAELRRKAS